MQKLLCEYNKINLLSVAIFPYMVYCLYKIPYGGLISRGKFSLIE